MPLKTFQIDPILDAKNMDYVPQDNVFDRMNWEACESPPTVCSLCFSFLCSGFFTDDPQLWSNQPVCVQIVKPPYKDEELIAVAAEVDKIYNGSTSQGEEAGHSEGTQWQLCH